MSISPALLKALFADSYRITFEIAAKVGHEESIRPPRLGGNPIHWILGHIVVSRCNFLMMLGQPSIWPWTTCAYFIPGSSPEEGAADHIRFETLRADLERTQEQLEATLAKVRTADLEALFEDRPLAEHLAFYATHEAFHAGQLQMLAGE